MPAWREQYDRMLRWHERFAIIDQGRHHDVSSDNYVDEIYAFFLDCYHVKDLLRNDPSLPAAVRTSVEAHIDSERSLRLSADICNGLKHLDLKTHRSSENPKFGRKRFKVGLGVGVPTTIGLKYEITTDRGPIDAFQLATDCVDSWKKFLAAHALT